MENPFRSSKKKGTSRPKNDDKKLIVGYLDPDATPSKYYTQMVGPYNHEPVVPHPNGSHPSQVPQNNPQVAASDPTFPSRSPFQPTDPHSFPYQNYGPPRLPNQTQQQNTQMPSLASFAPARPDIKPSGFYMQEQVPRVNLAAQSGYGLPVPKPVTPQGPLPSAPIFRHMVPIQNIPEANPFNTPAHCSDNSSQDTPPTPDMAPHDRSFLRSLVEAHAEGCSASGDDEHDGGEKASGLDEDLCRQNRSPSPSVLKRKRVDEELGRRVGELEAQVAWMRASGERCVAEMRGERDRMVAAVKERAVEAIGEALHDVCGIARGSVLWRTMVREAREKLEREVDSVVAAYPLEGEAVSEES